MKKNIPGIILILLKILLVAGSCICFLWYGARIPRIMVVHSYSEDYAWTNQVTQGLRRVLDSKEHISVFWQYMNAKKHPSFSARQKAGLMARRTISRLKPSVIIAVDDDAQDFVGKFYVDDPEISLIFCGVNGDIRNYGYGTATNVTGILERLPLDAVKESIRWLVSPGADTEHIRIVHLGDLSGTVKYDEDYILKFNWAPLNLVNSYLVSNYDDWKKVVMDANKRADCLYLSNYRQLEDKPGSGRYIPATEVMEWTMKNARVPVIGSNGFMVSDGGVLAIAASAYEQGEVAAMLALRILKGEPASSIPITKSAQFLVHMRKGGQNYPERLPAVYSAFAHGVGEYVGENAKTP